MYTHPAQDSKCDSGIQHMLLVHSSFDHPPPAATPHNHYQYRENSRTRLVRRRNIRLVKYR